MRGVLVHRRGEDEFPVAVMCRVLVRQPSSCTREGDPTHIVRADVEHRAAGRAVGRDSNAPVDPAFAPVSTSVYFICGTSVIFQANSCS